jgi:PIN domain nuclease of toxin-antitoxin system
MPAVHVPKPEVLLLSSRRGVQARVAALAGGRVRVGRSSFAAKLYSKTNGLPLGDRACLALAQRLHLAALTAGTAWSTLRLPVTVELIHERKT